MGTNEPPQCLTVGTVLVSVNSALMLSTFVPCPQNILPEGLWFCHTFCSSVVVLFCHCVSSGVLLDLLTLLYPVSADELALGWKVTGVLFSPFKQSFIAMFQ